MSTTTEHRTREEGFVLVLALFMLTICTMIGIAAMTTSTTEIDIAGNERVHKETFYQAEASSSAAAEALLDKDAYGEWTDNEKFADLGTDGYIKIKDGAFLLENRDVPSGSSVWNKDSQNDTVEAEPDVAVRISSQFNGDVDVDKVAVRYISGSGAEFGSGAEGAGVSSHKVIYNMDCVGTLPARNLRADDGSLNPQVPCTEIFLGYRYVPR
jgi:Tfp pilus assembly protein PilX